MLCPEGDPIQNDPLPKDQKVDKNQKRNKAEGEGTGNVELKSYKTPRSWRKSISNFFRSQLRSTKSNDGDGPSSSKEDFNEKDMSREQKWQSLGKIFRRQSFQEHSWSPGQGESTHSKRQPMRKVLSNYFGKTPKSSHSISDE